MDVCSCSGASARSGQLDRWRSVLALVLMLSLGGKGATDGLVGKGGI